jgi:hypothetical protein
MLDQSKIGLDLDPTQVTWASTRDVVSGCRIASAVPRQSIHEGGPTIQDWPPSPRGQPSGCRSAANTLCCPAMVDTASVTVDAVLGSRCVLGPGMGGRPIEYRDFGIEFGDGFGQRFDSQEESVAVVRALHRGELVSFSAGGQYHLQGVSPLPVPVAGLCGIPLLIGGAARPRPFPALRATPTSGTTKASAA